VGWIAKAFLTLALIALATVTAVWVGKDSELFRDFVAHEVGRLLQRSVQIGDLDIGLGPELDVTVKGLVIEQPPGLSGPPFVRVASARVQASLKDLLAQPPRIRQLSLSNPEIVLRQSTDGQTSWQFGEKKVEDGRPEPPREPRIPVLLDLGTVQNLQLDWIDADARSRTLAADATLASESDGFKLSLDGSLNGNPLTTDIRVFPTGAVMAFKKVNIAAELTLDEVSLVGKAFIGDLLAPQRPNIDLTLRGPSIEYFTDRLNMAPISSGPLDVNVSTAPTQDNMIVSVNGLVGDFSVVVSGEVNNLRTLSNSDLAVAINGPDIGRIAELAGMERVPHVPFSLSGKVRRRDSQLEISESRFNIGRLQVIGSMDIPDLAQPTRANLAAEASTPAIEVFSDLTGLPDSIKGAVATEIRLDASSGETTVSGSVTSDYGELAVDGQLGSQSDFSGTTINLRAQGKDLRRLLEVAALELPTTGEWSVATALSVTANQLQLSSGTARFEDVTGGFSGTLPREAPLANLSGNLTLSAADPRRSAQPWLGADHELLALIPDKPTDARFSGAWTGDRLELNQLNVSLPDASIDGKLTFNPESTSLAGSVLLLGSQLSGYLPPIEDLDWLPPGQLDLDLKAAGDFQLQSGALVVENLDFKWGDLTATGRFTTREDLTDLDIDLSAANAYDWFVIDARLGETGTLPMSASIILSLADNTLDINELNFETGLGGILRSSGELHFGESFAGTGLKVKVDLPDIQRFGLLAGVPLPHIPLQVDAAFSGTRTRLTAEQLQVTSLDSEFSGTMEIKNPEHPEIKLALTSPLLDMRPFLPPPPETPADGEEPETTAPAKAGKRDKNARLIPSTPIDLSPFAAFDADVSVEADRIVGHTRRLKDLQVLARVTQGSLIVDEASGTDESRGKITFSGFAVPGENGHRVGLDVDGFDINIGFPARNPDEVELLPRFNLMGEVYSTGSNLRELAAGLNGALQVTAGEGRVSSQASGLLTNAFLDELFDLVNPLRQQEDYTQVRCLTLLAEVKDGKLKGDPLATLVTSKFAVISKAQVDLSSEKLFLTFNTIPQRGLGISASTAFKPFVGVAGTLARPQLTLDPEGTIIQGSLAVMTGGISLIGKSVLDRFTVSKKSCRKAEDSFIDEHEVAEAAYLKFREQVLAGVVN